MADRVSVSITIGGTLSRDRMGEFAAIIDAEGLSTEWDGEPFVVAQLPTDNALTLMAHEVAWGRLDELEQFCVNEGLSFRRWSGGYSGQWSAERVVFGGSGTPAVYLCDEEERIVIDRNRVERLGSLDAVLAYFDAADAAVPPLRIIDCDHWLAGMVDPAMASVAQA